MPEKLLNDEVVKDLKEAFKQLKADVPVALFTEKGKKNQYAEIALALLKEFSEVEPRLKLSFHTLGDESAKLHNVTTSPTILIAPEKYRIRFMGAPLGEEGRSFVMALLMASRGASALKQGSRERIKALTEQRDIKVFVSPT